MRAWKTACMLLHTGQDAASDTDGARASASPLQVQGRAQAPSYAILAEP